jgi:hypothetical protein
VEDIRFIAFTVIEQRVMGRVKPASDRQGIFNVNTYPVPESQSPPV